MAAPESDAAEAVEAPRDDEAPVCCICHEAPRGVVLLACGHSILCVGCFNSLSAQPGDRAACPLCRAKLAPLALPLPPGESPVFLSAETRLDLLRPVLERLLHGTSSAAAEVVVAAGAPSDERARCLATLEAFASHSNDQGWMALSNSFLCGACAALNDSPLNAEVQAAGISLLCAMLAVKCRAVDEDTGEACPCTPEDLCKELEAHSVFNLAVVQPLRGFFAGASACYYPVASVACIAAQIMLSRRDMVPPRSSQTLDALARTLTSSVLVVFSYRAADASEEDEECEITLLAALRVLLLLLARDVPAAGAPEAAGAATTAFRAAVQRLFDERSTNPAAAYAALKCLTMLICENPDRAAAAACAFAAAEQGVAQALLGMCLLRCSCVCPNCALCLATAVLPVLQAVCTSSPEALSFALDEDEDEPSLVSTLSHVTAVFQRFNAVPAAVFRVVQAILTPPLDDGEDGSWRTECARAADALTSGCFIQNTITHRDVPGAVRGCACGC